MLRIQRTMSDVDLNFLGERLELDELLLRTHQQVRRDVDDERLLSVSQRNNLPLPDDGGARRHGSRLRVWRDHPEVEPAAERRLEVPRDGGFSLLDLTQRAAKQPSDVLTRRGRQGEDDPKRFLDVRRLGLVESVGAGGEVLDHVVESTPALYLRCRLARCRPHSPVGRFTAAMWREFSPARRSASNATARRAGADQRARRCQRVLPAPVRSARSIGPTRECNAGRPRSHRFGRRGGDDLPEFSVV